MKTRLRVLVRSRLIPGIFAMGVSVSSLSAQAPQAIGKPNRVLARGAWTTLWQIGTDSDLLLNPMLLAVDAGRAVLFDYGDHSVKSIRIGGGLEWRLGRSGEGPGEFANPTALAVDRLGQTIVLDPDLRRLTIISRAGKIVKTVRLAKGYDRLGISRSDTTMLLMSMRLDTTFLVVDQRGATRAVALRPSAVAEEAPLTREVRNIVSVANGYVVSFRWSSLLLRLNRNGVVVGSCTAVDSLGFPDTKAGRVRIDTLQATVTRVNPRGITAGFSAISIEGLLAVLTPERQPGGPRLLDYYNADCGRYRESRPFPFESTLLGAQGDSVVALINEPVPHLALLRWRPQ